MSAGPAVRTDVFDVYIFRRDPVEFLQLKRAEAPLLDTWQPIMGHIEIGEATQMAMWREVLEEVGLSRESRAFSGAWSLEGVYPFYLAKRDAVMMSPRFAIEVTNSWRAVLNAENSEARWVSYDNIESHFMWPGQRLCIAEIVRDIVGGAVSEPHLRI